MKSHDPLFTNVQLSAYPDKLTYADKIVLAGSCFAEHIGKKLTRYKYNVLSNPSGILYNSNSIARAFERIAKQKYYRHDELIMHQGMYHSMDHHGAFSGADPDDVLRKINDSLNDAHSHLLKTKMAFISLGTSHVYRLKQTNRIVGNNHKMPSDLFVPHSISVKETIEDLEKIYRYIRKLSPAAHVIWSVSPIRHLRDGLVENQRSKSVLILAISEFIASQSDTAYFPAYEIMLDQLRDYRFYAKDMTHPSELAIDIIWKLFSENFIDSVEMERHQSIEQIQRAIEHRILHDNDIAIKSFAAAQLSNIDQLAIKFPDLNWKDERQYFFHLTEPD